MKKQFPGHFSQNKRDIRRLWDTCIFVFDANILLNLYRYSDKTRNEFLQTLDSVRDRIWLPHRAAEEFFANRLSVIGQQEKAYDDTIRTIDALNQDLANARQHPFVSDPTMKRVKQIFDKLKQELTANQKVHTKRITEDSIQEAIAKIFAGRVGEPYDLERLNAIFEEGMQRYAESIPPGFKDNRKTDDSGAHSEKCRKYGDLLVWFQILDHAKAEGVSAILVTDDKKEDWWQTFRGKTLGARPELVHEFQVKTKKPFHMYQADRFLELSNQYLEQNITETTLSEIREVRLRDVEVHQAIIQKREREMARRAEYEAICSKRESLREHLSMLKEEHQSILSHRHAILNSISEDISDAQRHELMMSALPRGREIEERILQVERELANLDRSREYLRRDMRDMKTRRRIIEQKSRAYADRPPVQSDADRSNQ